MSLATSGPALRSSLALLTVAAAGLGAGSVAAAPPKNPTTTNVVCPTHAAAGRPVTCGVSVTDTGANPTAPTGKVRFATNLGSNHGTFNGPGTCDLKKVDSRTARCTITYTPTKVEATRIYGTYLGDDHHATSSGHADINA